MCLYVCSGNSLSSTEKLSGESSRRNYSIFNIEECPFLADNKMAGMRSSYYPNYFSLEDILASEERIPVEVFNETIGFHQIFIMSHDHDFNIDHV